MTLEEFKIILKRRLNTEYISDYREWAIKNHQPVNLPEFDEGFQCGIVAVLQTLPEINREVTEFWDRLNHPEKWPDKRDPDATQMLSSRDIPDDATIIDDCAKACSCEECHCKEEKDKIPGGMLELAGGPDGQSFFTWPENVSFKSDPKKDHLEVYVAGHSGALQVPGTPEELLRILKEIRRDNARAAGNQTHSVEMFPNSGEEQDSD